MVQTERLAQPVALKDGPTQGCESVPSRELIQCNQVELPLLDL